MSLTTEFPPRSEKVDVSIQRVESASDTCAHVNEQSSPRRPPVAAANRRNSPNGGLVSSRRGLPLPQRPQAGCRVRVDELSGRGITCRIGLEPSPLHGSAACPSDDRMNLTNGRWREAAFANQVFVEMVERAGVEFGDWQATNERANVSIVGGTVLGECGRRAWMAVNMCIY